MSEDRSDCTPVKFTVKLLYGICFSNTFHTPVWVGRDSAYTARMHFTGHPYAATQVRTVRDARYENDRESPPKISQFHSALVNRHAYLLQHVRNKRRCPSAVNRPHRTTHNFRRLGCVLLERN